ncbi:BID domain-containing T4SS effector [Bartonella sp. MM73XJBT.G]|uniref:BID domain-containing T4SS effector n=1 Tax=Bartonella sp. MM73XJBT.G TaxID=3019097 RepID=UPI00236026BD|nr:BID domain-containing T4SS effector [Bartonella sp. MM73XJBT.G]
MKKRTPSPFITEMMEKFQQQTEQSPTRTSPPQVSPKPQKPPLQKQPENFSPPPKVAPPPPPRVREKTPTEAKIQKPETQETPPLQAKVAPPKPPRAKERQQHSPQVEDFPSHPKVAPPPPPRVREKIPTEAKIQKPETQETPPLQAKIAPPKPPRAKERQQQSPQVEASSSPPKVAPPPPPRVREKIPTEAKIQKTETLEHPTTQIKTPPQRPPRAKDRIQHKTAVQKEENPYATPRAQTPPGMRENAQTSTKSQNPETPIPSVRPKTAQHRTVRQQSSSSSQDSEIYAVPRSSKAHQIRDRKQSGAVTQKTGSPQTANEPPKPPQEQKTSFNTMEKEFLLIAYHEEIRFLCEKVYGDRLILEQRIEEIRENPPMGEQLLWDVRENPQSISKLAGRKVLGIKSHARKEAEETLPNLSEAINGFVYTSKYIQENISRSQNISRSPHTKQRQHQHAQQEEAIAQHTPNPLNSEKKIGPLSNQEIARRVQQDPSVQYGQREVQYWSQIVYNDPFILQYRMEDMHKIPDMGEELVFQIEKDPTFFAPLAGRKTLGIKNAARKAAEENLPTLCTAIKDYADTIKQLRETIVQNHQTEQQQRHQPLTDLDKKLQKQQSLSEPQKLPERSTTKRRQEVTETSRQEEHPPIRPRRGETSKAMALS